MLLLFTLCIIFVSLPFLYGHAGPPVPGFKDLPFLYGHAGPPVSGFKDLPFLYGHAGPGKWCCRRQPMFFFYSMNPPVFFLSI